MVPKPPEGRIVKEGHTMVGVLLAAVIGFLIYVAAVIGGKLYLALTSLNL